MEKYVIGLMSGTSLDGLDMAYVKFNTENLSDFTIIKGETIPYSKYWFDQLKASFKMSADQLMYLDAAYGQFLGNQVNAFMKRHKIEKVDLIASHGQTVFHRPELGYTTQIGSGAHINAITGIKTICDFRRQDVALGGQGAPLVPIGDRLLFSTYDDCINIGGFANISFEKDRQRLAFDICPANIVLNHYINKIGLNYDNKGQMAATGKIDLKLLRKLNELPEYEENQPKSFGWEMVVNKIIPLIDRQALKLADILKTYVEHIATQIGRHTHNGKILITGGGAFNDYLIKRIKAHTSGKVIIPDPMLINYKEALIFALLGLLKDMGQVNILASVTGCKQDHSSGVIFDYKNI